MLVADRKQTLEAGRASVLGSLAVVGLAMPAKFEKPRPRPPKAEPALCRPYRAYVVCAPPDPSGGPALLEALGLGDQKGQHSVSLGTGEQAVDNAGQAAHMLDEVTKKRRAGRKFADQLSPTRMAAAA